MKLHQLISTVVVLCLPFALCSMEKKPTSSCWVIDPTNATTWERRFEDTTQQILKNFSKKLECTAPKPKQSIPAEIYREIQIRFTPTVKDRISSFQKIEFNEADKKKLLQIAQLKKEADTSTQQKELVQKIKEIEQKIANYEDQRKQNLEHIQQLEKEINIRKKENQRRKNAHKRARQKAKKQQPSLLRPSTIQQAAQSINKSPNTTTPASNTTKSKPVTPQQSYFKKRMVALKTLFKKYNVQKESNLKEKLNDICQNINEDYFKDRINHCCTFEYYASTNQLEIFTDDYENATFD
jgi:hypothetical protein